MKAEFSKKMMKIREKGCYHHNRNKIALKIMVGWLMKAKYYSKTFTMMYKMHSKNMILKYKKIKRIKVLEKINLNLNIAIPPIMKHLL